MKNFTVNGTEYIEKENGYCYKVEDGKLKRISREAFETAYSQYEDEQIEIIAEDEIYEVVDDEQEPAEPAKPYVKAADIEQTFVDVVNRYLASGMVFSLGSMNGSQGEISKVDLTDRKDVYRIMLDSENVFFDDENGFGGSVEAKALTVEKFADAYQPDSAVSKCLGYTLWNGHGELIEKIQWYTPSYRGREGRNQIYFTDLDTVRSFSTIRRDRWRAKTESAPAKEREIALTQEQKLKVRDIARKHRGYMRVKARYITKFVRVLNGKVDRPEHTIGVPVYRIYFNESCGKEPLEIGIRVKTV